MTRLLIIGAGEEQINAYKIAKNMGLQVVGTDINPNAPAFEFADDKLICSTRDSQQTLNSVLIYSKTKKIDGVMTLANDVPLTVSIIAKHLNLPGISIESALSSSDKSLMKTSFVKNNIPTPAYEICKTKNEFYKNFQKKQFPFILKPVDGRGSRGVLFLDDTINLDWAWEHALKYSEKKILLLEQYVEGDQLSVEGIFYKKKNHIIAFADRNYSNLSKTKPYIVENGGVIPSRYEGEILDKISEIIQNAAQSLGIEWGSVKADIVLSNTGPMIIEIAARLSGNYLATHHIPWAYGVDIVKLMICLSLNIPLENKSFVPKTKKYLGVRYFFPKPGKIKSILGITKVRKQKSTRMLKLFKTKGDIQTIIDSHVSRAGTIVCEGDSYDEAIKHVTDAINQINFVMDKNYTFKST